MLVCNECGKPYNNAGGHCTVCHESFASQASFDHHILGDLPGRPHMVMVDLEDTMWRKNHQGLWTDSAPMTDKAREQLRAFRG